MTIELEEHKPEWEEQFENLKAELIDIIGFTDPHVEHIGSTAVKRLLAKPIIDILIGLESTSLLDEVVKPLIDHGYIYYPIYNNLMPYRRFFVKHRSKVHRLNIPKTINDEKDIPNTTEEHNLRLAHIHVLKYNSDHWVRHIAFRNYLREHPNVQREYRRLKEVLRTNEWSDGNDYNKAKDTFIKTEEKKAIDWYTKTTER